MSSRKTYFKPAKVRARRYGHKFTSPKFKPKPKPTTPNFAKPKWCR